MQSGSGMKQAMWARYWRFVLAGGACIVLLGIISRASDKKSAAAQMVDSGSFAVMMNGHRVATENFSIVQDTDGSSITSQFKSEAGAQKAEQTSDLRLSANGDLSKYEWKELSPGQSHAVVEPDQSFLIEHVWKIPTDKPLDQPFLLPASTTILDDYFFVQREVLAWRYLATNCKQEKGQVSCPLKQKAQMGTLNPHARASTLVTIDYAGREKVTIHGIERELIRLDMSSDVGESSMWLDDTLKVQRMLVPAEGTEVVRD
jgi:hypothetical protein